MTQEYTPEQMQEARAFKPIDPLEYAQHNIEQDRNYSDLTAQDSTLQQAQSDILGSEFYFSPNESGYMVEFGKRFYRAVDRDSYLDIRNHELHSINDELHNLPREVQNYFRTSASFNRAVGLTYYPGAEEERRRETAIFLLKHNEYANEKREAIEGLISDSRQLILNRIPELVTAGVLPNKALHRLSLVGSVSISLTDKARGYENKDLGGYYDAEGTKIALSLYWDDATLAEVAVHELVHLISGHRIVKNMFRIQNVERVGLRQVTIEQNEIKYMEGGLEENEAYTQLITNLVQNPNMDIKTAIAHGNIYRQYMRSLWRRCGRNDKAVASGFDAYYTSDNGLNEGDFDRAQVKREEIISAILAEKTKQLKRVTAGVLFLGATGLVVMRNLKR